MYGKYRAKVINNTDPEFMGRIKVSCPYVYGESESPWCLPCMPIIGVERGIYSPPQIGDTVWVEFEGGNTEKPIYTGGWWTKGNVPTTDPDIEVFVSKAGHRIVIQNRAGSESITVLEKHGHNIVMNNTGIVVEAVGKDITLRGNRLFFNSTQIGG